MFFISRRFAYHKTNNLHNTESCFVSTIVLRYLVLLTLHRDTDEFVVCSIRWEIKRRPKVVYTLFHTWHDRLCVCVWGGDGVRTAARCPGTFLVWSFSRASTTHSSHFPWMYIVYCCEWATPRFHGDALLHSKNFIIKIVFSRNELVQVRGVDDQLHGRESVARESTWYLLDFVDSEKGRKWTKYEESEKWAPDHKGPRARGPPSSYKNLIRQ